MSKRSYINYCLNSSPKNPVLVNGTGCSIIQVSDILNTKIFRLVTG